ncbi:hypothetical protein FH610_022150 [Microbispora catharanthi]|uniref:Tyrosine-type recombinase/integrase n=1 Tax=Microbispora catharanthi TaxID=1712871 RepID=A0A5N6BRY4_9ACTN|nr:hypothetical protein FH610_022150 [Microbispora catharanthi]
MSRPTPPLRACPSRLRSSVRYGHFRIPAHAPSAQRRRAERAALDVPGAIDTRAPPPVGERRRSASKTDPAGTAKPSSPSAPKPRNTGNTIAASAGASLRGLMARMGHDSVRAAMIYQHRTTEADKGIADAANRKIKTAKIQS